MASSGNEDDAAMRARLETLSNDIEARRGAETVRRTTKAPPDGGLGEGMSMAFRVVTELVVGICVGGGIGWLIDRVVHTKPLFLILFGLVGTAAGFWNIIRVTTPKGREAAAAFHDRIDASKRGSQTGRDENEDKTIGS